MPERIFFVALVAFVLIEALSMICVEVEKIQRGKGSLIFGTSSFRLWGKPNTLWCAFDKTTIIKKNSRKLIFSLTSGDKGNIMGRKWVFEGGSGWLWKTVFILLYIRGVVPVAEAGTRSLKQDYNFQLFLNTAAWIRDKEAKKQRGELLPQ
jgi:hypothetical protein